MGRSTCEAEETLILSFIPRMQRQLLAFLTAVARGIGGYFPSPQLILSALLTVGRIVLPTSR